MAWERSIESRVLKVRDRELKYQKLNYMIEVRKPTCNPLFGVDLMIHVGFMECHLE